MALYTTMLLLFVFCGMLGHSSAYYLIIYRWHIQNHLSQAVTFLFVGTLLSAATFSFIFLVIGLPAHLLLHK